MLSFELCSTWAPDFIAALHRHYTGSAGPPYGKKLAWRVYETLDTGDSRLIGYMGLGEPSYKLAPRRALGLDDARPAEHTVSMFLYRLEGPRETGAATILRAWEPIAANDWRDRYGWTPVHWESMVGQGDEKNLGACYAGARWRRLGWTTGRSARRPPGHTHGKRVWGDSSPKLVFYRGPLSRVGASS